MKEKLQKIIDSKFGTACGKFCSSVLFSVAIGVVSIIAHSFNTPILGAVLFTLLLVPALIFCKNLFVLVPFMLMCSFVFSPETRPGSSYYNNVGYIIVLFLLLAILICAFIFNLVYYGTRRKILNKTYLIGSFIFLAVALWMSGIGSATMTFRGFGLSIGIFLSMFVPYLFLTNCGKYERDKTARQIAYAFITAAAVIAIGYLQQFIKNDFNLDVNAVKGYLNMGFVGPNDGAAIIVLAIPLTFYLVYTCKHGFLWMIAVALEVVTVLLTFSRASFLVALGGTAVVSIALCFKQKRERLGYWIAFGICAVAALAVCIAFRHAIIEQLKVLFVGNTTGSGRTTIWKLGFEAWKENPVFGTGIGFLLSKGYAYYSFHNTILTYLYCGGVVALAAYLFHRYKTVRLVFSTKLTPERVFAALTVLAMLCNALLDVAMTHCEHLIFYSILLAFIECDVQSVKNEQSEISLAPTLETPTDKNESN